MVEIVSIQQDEITDFKMLAFGEDKVGKTSLIKTLPASSDEKILYIGADPGELALRGRSFRKIKVDNGDWSMSNLRKIHNLCLLNAGNFEWIAVDGLNKIGDRVVEESKIKNSYGPAAWDEANLFMDWWISAMRDISGPKTFFITHDKTETDDTGKIHHRPDMPGNRLKNEINRYFDVIVCMRMVQETESKKFARVLQCNRDYDPEYKVGDRSGVLSTFEPPHVGSLLEKIQSQIPELRAVDVDAALRANLSVLAKSSKELYEAIKEKAKSLGVKSFSEFKTAQLQELLAMGKEVIK